MITLPFRIGSWLKSKNSMLARLCLIPVKCIYKCNQHITGIQVPLGTDIGGGLLFFHYGCIVIAQEAHIGKNASIHQGVTIGRVFAGHKSGVPTIGDNVVIFAGAKILGNIKIGNNVVIGANATVTNNVPDNSVVAGSPAKIISDNSAKCFDEYWTKFFGWNL